MQTITKERISKQIEGSLGLPSVICEEMVTQIFKSAENIILEYGQLKIKNLGSFKVIQKNERPGRNIQTNTTAPVTARKVLRFSPSRNLKGELNQHG